MPKSNERDRYLAIIEAMGEGVLLISRKHRITLSNRSACSMLSWVSPLKGKLIEVVFSSSFLPATIENVFRTGRKEELKITSYLSSSGADAVIKGKGREKIYKFSITLLDDKYAVVTITDETMMERMSVVRQDFVSNVSHELKTPLTAITGFAETLMDENLSAEETKSFARIIHKNSTQMQRIISDLLLLTSLDREEIAPAMESTTDTKILSEVRAYTQFRAEANSIAVSYSPEGFSLICSESLIVQALINLVVNAISYSPQGSTVSISSRKKGDRAEFKVSDRGFGISEDDLPRIFERFYRVDKARSRESGGTGLGLSIVRHIAIIHKGTIKAESRLGEGSEFTLSIPLR